MIEMNLYAIMRMTIDTLKPSSPDLGTCFISTLGESEIDTLTLTINMKNHHLPSPKSTRGWEGFCQCCEGQGRSSSCLGANSYVPSPPPWFVSIFLLLLFFQLKPCRSLSHMPGRLGSARRPSVQLPPGCGTSTCG